MVEPIRQHERVGQRVARGDRMDLSMGHLYLPEKHSARPPLLVFFHGPSWLVEDAAEHSGMASLSISLGAGSGTYEKPFLDAARFLSLIDEAQGKAKVSFGAITLAGWSAARLGGFEWSDIEHTAAAIWNRAVVPGATTSVPLAIANATTLHLKRPAPAVARIRP